MRDLARADPWRESLERSRARRGPARAKSKRPLPSLGPKRFAALALFAAVVAGGLAGGGTHGSPAPARADARQSVSAPAHTASHVAARPAAAGRADCPLAIAPSGYVNPLAGAAVKPERIDQGVDYAGSGGLVAIGAARITRVATSNSGWPGTFLEYQLLDGADAGCFVFYAEGVKPVDGLRVGQTVSAGDTLATIRPQWPTGIEIGWGAGIGAKAYAQIAGQWSPTNDRDNMASAAGKNFSALIAALGGPPGVVEG